MTSLVAERCLIHPEREAVARCPECRRFFCRECVSEHDDRVLCARCLSQGSTIRPEGSSRFGHIIRCCGAMLGIAVGWWFFDLVGRGLMLIPASVHEGSVWEEFSTDE